MTHLTADPLPGDTVGVIRSLLPSLVPSEQRVAQACADDAPGVAMLSVADLAARTGTSPATVIRACQNLGFRGFQHLRLLLLRDLGVAESTRDSDVGRASGSRGRVPALFESAARDLNSALGALDYDAFDAAAQAIASARRVLLVSNGGSGPSAQMMALRLLTAGRPVEAPYDSVTQQLSARTLGSGDVCIAVSDSGMNSVTLRAVKAARAAGATVVGVTSYSRSPLSQLADHSLVAGATYHSWADGAVSGNIVQVLLLAALQDAVASALGHSSAPSGPLLDEAFEIIEGE